MRNAALARPGAAATRCRPWKSLSRGCCWARSAWTGADAAVPDTIAGDIPTATFAAPTSFREILHLEQEKYLYASPNQTVASPPENVSHLFWTNGREPDQFETPIPFVDATAISGPACV